MDTEDSPGIPRSSKRRRLNFACNYCRSRKTRCDEQQPSCQACILAGIACVTEDRRRPGKLIKRREAGKSTDGGSVTSASPSEYGLQAGADGAVERRHSIAEPRTIAVVTGPIRARSQSPRPSQSRDSSHTDTISNPLPIWRQSAGTTSFQVLTEWLDLACFRLSIPYHFGSYPPSTLNPQSASQPQHGIPITPETWVPQTLFDAYAREIHTFYPVVRLDQARADVVQSHPPHPGSLTLHSVDIAALRSHLLFAAGGCILQHAERKAYMTETLSLARNALGHLIGNVSYDTIEVLFLFSLGYVSTISDDAFDTMDLDVLKSTALEPSRISLSMANVFSKMSHLRRTLCAYQKTWASRHLCLYTTITPSSCMHMAVEIIAKDTPWEYQIRNGQSMVANSARKIIHLLADNDDSASHLFAPAYFPLLHAMYVLAVHILKQPHSRVSKIDQSLLVTAADLVRCYCVGLSEEDRLNTILNGLLRVVQEAMRPISAPKDNDHRTPALNSSTSLSDQNVTPLTDSQGGNQTFAESLGQPDPAMLSHPNLSMDEGILDPFSGQPFNMPILPDEIGCDWADFENLLQRLGSEGSLYPGDEGMVIDI
ncbi:hypothetical protein FOC1_g10003004 [Fusarium oxysporum f. sp. cubense race 1]|uniref:Zn(2)-C6 fungal-type domain-containing protein n=1 Tax=Fusarium oxysporum f. sp. cubense (strain race 1) TaxID=1229664 RepID=N4UX71_FUSC1|nr:hypothetical protein FOC1_g10003004 [Fusarium oxysporum f. sp. cubense race 1]